MPPCDVFMCDHLADSLDGVTIVVGGERYTLGIATLSLVVRCDVAYCMLGSRQLTSTVEEL